MHEPTLESRKPKTRWQSPHFVAGVVILALGLLAGRSFFPLEITTPFIVEKEKRVVVPVDRIVEKRIEVPVERIVERRVEVPVVRRVEVPVEKIVYRDKTPAEKPSSFFSSSSSWADLSIGMSRQQVSRILGRPRSAEGDGVSIIESWFYGSSTRYGAPGSVRFGVDGVIGWDNP